MRPTPKQLQVNFRQELTVEKRTVIGPRLCIHIEPFAKRIQACRCPWEFLPSDLNRIDPSLVRNGCLTAALQFHVQEAAVEFGIVRNECRIADEIQKRVNDGRILKLGLIDQVRVSDPSNSDRCLGHGSTWIDIGLERLSGRDVVDQLDGTEFDDAVILVPFKPGGFGIESYFTNQIRHRARPSLKWSVSR